jgi:hypothetical protein
MSFIRRFNAFTCFLTTSINIITVSRVFSISRITIKLKNIIFNIYNYLFVYSGVVVSLFRRGTSALAPYSKLYRLYSKPYFPLSTHINADILLLRYIYSI